MLDRTAVFLYCLALASGGGHRKPPRPVSGPPISEVYMKDESRQQRLLRGCYEILWKKHVQFFHGSSTDPAILSEMVRRVKGRKTLVALDSDHSMRHVLQELRMYPPMVSSGSYLVVEDTHLDGTPTHPEQGPGPYAAALRFLREVGRRDFQQDSSREMMVMTFNPGGWLRRK